MLWSPRLIDGMYVATDGAVLVEVPEIEVSNVPDDLEITEEEFPKYKALVDEAFANDLKAMDGPVCSPRPAGRRRCFDCRGQGLIFCKCPKCKKVEHECEACGGIGSYDQVDRWLAMTPGGNLRCLHVEIIDRLPDVSWFQAFKNWGPVVFTFGQKGRGLVMPLKDKTATS